MTAATIPGLDTAPTKHKELLAWVSEVAELTQPDRVVFADGSEEENERLSDQLVAAGTFKRLNQAEEAELLPRAVRPVGRGARGVAHLHLFRARNRRRSHQQLDGPGRDARHHDRPVPRLHARPHHVRSAVLHGPARRRGPQARCRDHRLRVRRRVDAHDDPDGPGRAGQDGRRRLLRQGAALDRRAAGARPERRAVAVQRHQVHQPLPGDPRDLELRLRLRRQRAARQEVLLAAHRVGDGPRRGLARRAHADPQADLAGEQGVLHRRGVPVGVRQDQPRDAAADDPGLARRDRRRRHRLDAVRQGRPAVRGQPGVRLLRRRARHQLEVQPERDEDHRGGQHRLHQRRADRRQRRVVGGPGGRTRPPHRLEGQRLDPARDGKQGRPSELALLHADVAVPDAGPGVGRPAGRADLGDPVRWPPQDDGAAGDAGPRLAARRVHRRHAGFRADRRRRGQGRHRPA